MVSLNFTVYFMKLWIENGITQIQGKDLSQTFDPRVKRQTIRKINYSMKGKTIFKAHEELLSNPRLKFNQIRKLKKLELYWKLRTEETELLGKVPLKEIFPIRFIPVGRLNKELAIFKLNNDFVIQKRMSEEELERFAIKDGFNSFRELFSWFSEKYKGDLFNYYFAVIRW